MARVVEVCQVIFGEQGPIELFFVVGYVGVGNGELELSLELGQLAEGLRSDLERNSRATR